MVKSKLKCEWIATPETAILVIVSYWACAERWSVCCTDANSGIFKKLCLTSFGWRQNVFINCRVFFTHRLSQSVFLKVAIEMECFQRVAFYSFLLRWVIFKKLCFGHGATEVKCFQNFAFYSFYWDESFSKTWILSHFHQDILRKLCFLSLPRTLSIFKNLFCAMFTQSKLEKVAFSHTVSGEIIHFQKVSSQALMEIFEWKDQQNGTFWWTCLPNSWLHSQNVKLGFSFCLFMVFWGGVILIIHRPFSSELVVSGSEHSPPGFYRAALPAAICLRFKHSSIYIHLLPFFFHNRRYGRRITMYWSESFDHSGVICCILNIPLHGCHRKCSWGPLYLFTIYSNLPRDESTRVQ